MIEAAIEKVKHLALEAASLLTVKVPAEPEDVYYLHDRKSGKYDRMTAEPKPRGYSASRLVDVVDLVKEFAARDASKKIVIFAAGGVVTVLLDEDGGRRERLKLTAPKSAQYLRLVKMCDERPFSHVDFVDLLRIDLHGAVSDDFLGLVKSMKFRADSSGMSDVSPGRESMGRQVENEVLASGKVIPETTVLRVPVYEDLVDEDGQVYTGRVECVFVTSAGNCTLRLVPLKDQLLAAVREADAWVLEKLKPLEELGENVRVFCGAA